MYEPEVCSDGTTEPQPRQVFCTALIFGVDSSIVEGPMLNSRYINEFSQWLLEGFVN